jgi:hypothetical protein
MPVLHLTELLEAVDQLSPPDLDRLRERLDAAQGRCSTPEAPANDDAPNEAVGPGRTRVVTGVSRVRSNPLRAMLREPPPRKT